MGGVTLKAPINEFSGGFFVTNSTDGELHNFWITEHSSEHRNVLMGQLPCNQPLCFKQWHSSLPVHNAEHSGDLGVATKEPRKGRPAAIGRILLRLVMGQEHNTLTLAESAGTVLCRMNKKHSSLHAWVLVKHGKTHTRRNTGMSR